MAILIQRTRMPLEETNSWFMALIKWEVMPKENIKAASLVDFVHGSVAKEKIIIDNRSTTN